MAKYTWLFDNGHGAVINGVPQTDGKRSPDFGDGILYEGVSNRLIVAKVMHLCKCANIKHVNLVPELTDVSLGERVRRANKHKNAVFLSFHSDAFHKESANGWSAFTYYGQSDSDKMASLLYAEAKAEGFKLREDWTDGDPDKEANFFVLRETNMPAVLIENLFMTNEKDYKFLLSEKGQDVIANLIFRAILNAERYGL